MAGGLVEEVGARLVLLGKKEFLAATAAARKEIVAMGRTTAETNAKIVLSEQAVAAARAEASVALLEAAALRQKAAEATTRAVGFQAAGELEAAKAAKAEAAELTRAAGASTAHARAAKASAAASLEQAGAIRAHARAADTLSAVGAGRMSKTVQGIAGVGRKALLGLAVTGAVVGVASVKMAGDFQQSMEMIHTQAGLPQSRLAELSRGLLDLAPKVALGPKALADQLYRIASATAGLGYSNKTLLAMTKAAAQLTTIGGPGTDPEQTARVLGAVAASGIKGAKTPQDVVALANATVGAGDMRMNDFVAALGSGVLGQAKAHGIGLRDIGAWTALLTDNAMSGSVAGHMVNHGISLLADPSTAATKVYKTIGLGTTQLSEDLRSGGIIKAFDDLQKHLNGMVKGLGPGGVKAADAQLLKFGFSAAQVQGMNKAGPNAVEQSLLLTRAFGGAKQSSAIVLPLIELDRLKAKVKAIEDGSKNFGDAWAKTTDNFKFKTGQLAVGIAVLAIRIGDRLIPVLMTLGHATMQVVRWFERHQTTTKALAIGLGTVLVGAIGLYAFAMGQAAIATLAATWPVLAVIAGVALLAAGIYVLWTKWDTIWGWISHHQGLAVVAGLILAVVAPLVLFGLGLVALWKQSQTFRDIVVKVFQVVGTAVLGFVADALGVLKVFAETSDFLFGTHFTKTINGALRDIAKLQNKLDHINDPKPIEIGFFVKQLNDAQPWNAVQFPASGKMNPAMRQPSWARQVLGGIANPTHGTQVAGQRAYGGAVQQMRRYVVGEEGPEIFTAPASGTITSHARARSLASVGAYDSGSDSGSGSTGGGWGGATVTVMPGAIVIHESGDPHKTYEAARQGLADAIARR